MILPSKLKLVSTGVWFMSQQMCLMEVGFEVVNTCSSWIFEVFNDLPVNLY